MHCCVLNRRTLTPLFIAVPVTISTLALGQAAFAQQPAEHAEHAAAGHHVPKPAHIYIRDRKSVVEGKSVCITV